MNYLINNIPLESYGFRAGWIGKSDEAYALSGIFDLPRRTGENFHDWGAQGVEPYVDADDICFEVRNFDFSVVTQCNSVEEFRTCLHLFLAAIGDHFNLNGLEVILLQANVTGYNNGWGCAEIKLRELYPIQHDDLTALPGVTIPATYGIDGYSWSELGLVAGGLDGRYDLPQWQPLKLTAANHAYGDRQAGSITLKGTIIGDDYAHFLSNTQMLRSVIGRAGTRTIRYFDGTVLSAFCTDGFTISGVRHFSRGTHWGQFQCKMITL